MNHWKYELKQAFDVPKPTRKKAFLREIPIPQMSVSHFLLSQIGYIRKKIWCISALIFITAIFGLTCIPDHVLWLISGLTPLLALTIISESGRSECYNMAELEMATRFSLKSITFARLSILGLVNGGILALLLLIGLWNDTVLPLAAALYIITPFLLTSFTGLYIVRKIRGQESLYACIGTSVGISIFLFLSHTLMSFIYQDQWLMIWLLAALFLFFGTGKQCIAMLKNTEDFAWN